MRDMESTRWKMGNRENPSAEESHLASQVALAPIYSPLDVAEGIQAYRRGDMILYTIRGEPSAVQKLIGELDRRGVGEVVALVSHRAADVDSDEPRDEGGSSAGEDQQ